LELPTFSDSLAARRRLALWVPVLLGLGIGLYFALPVEPTVWLFAVAALAAALIGYVGRNLSTAKWLAIASFIVYAGMLVASLRTAAVEAPVLRKTLYHRTVEGRIDDIQIKEQGQRFVLSGVSIERVQEKTTPARVSITYKEPTQFQVGDRIRLRAILFSPPAPVMPGAYDFARAFYYERLGAVGYTPRAPELIESAPPEDFRPWLNRLRLGLAERIGASMPAAEGAVASALMVGEASQIPEEVKDAMRDSGLYHILSISGLHMTLAAGLIYAVVRFLLCLHMPLAQRLPVKKIAAGVGLLGAFIYLLLAGYPVPAVRSFVMIACVLVAVMFDRRGISLYSLAWAACIILLLWPESILGASFQLSFAATLAVVALYERYGHAIHRGGAGFWRRLRNYFFALMCTSLAATLATTPLVIYHFNRFTVWGIVANMFLAPLASFWIMSAALLSFLAMPLGLEAVPLAILQSGITIMLEGARWFASLPFASVAVYSPNFAGFLMIVAGGVWLCLSLSRWRLLGVPLVILGMATALMHKPYDLYVSDEGTKVMVRVSGHDYLFLRGTPGSFDGEAWLKWEGQDDALEARHVRHSSMEVTCVEKHCGLTLDGRRLLVARKGSTAHFVCQEKPDILIAEIFISGMPCNTIPLIIDREFLDKNGATTLRFIGLPKVEITTANALRRDRPWVVRPYSNSKLYQSDDQDMMPGEPQEKADP
jgi:competence protein ComEC